MSIVRQRQYTQAGRVILPENGFGFRPNVYLPGGEYTADRQEDGFHAPDMAKPVRKRRKATLPAGLALAIVLAVFILFLCLIIGKLVHNQELIDQINCNANAITDHRDSLMAIEAELAEKGSKINICYRAVQDYGMITSAGAETYRITLAQTPVTSADNTAIPEFEEIASR